MSMKDLDQSEVERLAEGHAPSGVEDYDEVLTPLAREVLRHRERAIAVHRSEQAGNLGDLSDFEIETFIGLSGGNSVLRRALVEIQRRRREAR